MNISSAFDFLLYNLMLKESSIWSNPVAVPSINFVQAGRLPNRTMARDDDKDRSEMLDEHNEMKGPDVSHLKLDKRGVPLVPQPSHEDDPLVWFELIHLHKTNLSNLACRIGNNHTSTMYCSCYVFLLSSSNVGRFKSLAVYY